jgi:hypothetical protein
MPKPKTQQRIPSISTEGIYNLLMCEIEPELCTEMIPELDTLYADETEEERRERGQRYAAAFEEFAKRFEKLTSLWKEHLLAFKKKTMAKLKVKAAEREGAELESIERQFDAGAASP